MKSVKNLFTLLLLFIAGSALFAQAPIDWMHMKPSEGYYGSGMNQVYEKIIKEKKGSPVIVAIIDSGVDVEHEDLRDVIWVNNDEIPNNNIDDDKNGYVDDVHGWNFIGGPDGNNVHHDTYEVTRLFAKYREKYENVDPEKLNKKEKEEYQNYLEFKKEVEKKRSSAERGYNQMMQTQTLFEKALSSFEEKFGDKEITSDKLSQIETNGDMQMELGKRAITQVLNQIDHPLTIDDIRQFILKEINGGVAHYKEQLDYAYNPDYNSRTIVQDDYSNAEQRIYGNNEVEGPDATHGTHVAGIVGAVRDNDTGMNGMANNVRIMSVRAVPDGDERDKDVANAIRYAVDNGASVINMSFGKGYSWNKKVVEDAIKYAAKNDVLLVHAAGNSGQDNDTHDNFPNKHYSKKCLLAKKQAKNWIEVGALNYTMDESMVAPFSNYGMKNVDVFAPGMAIYSTVPNDRYEFLQGTSMASPVVAGVAALIRSYYPSLTARQVKQVIEDSAIKIHETVSVPGEDKTAPFSELCVTGGVVNAYNALRLAKSVKGKKRA